MNFYYGTALSRNEMKEVKGGFANYTVNCKTTKGYHQESPGSCSGTEANCQKAADDWCKATAGCASCTLATAV